MKKDFYANYKSGFCQSGLHEPTCRGNFPAAGKTKPLDCVCLCHRLRQLIDRMGMAQIVEILEVFDD